MSAVFERYPNGGGEMLLALALADHASDDGGRVYPSVKALAEKTRQSERTVQYQLRRMEMAGWLILVNAGNGGRSLNREYRISPDWIDGVTFDNLQKGAEIAPFKKGANCEKGATDDTKGCNPRQKRVQQVAPAYNHQRTIKESSGGERVRAQALATTPCKTRLPDDLQPCESVTVFARQHGLSMAKELAAFRDHHAAKGSTFADWQAALRTWFRNSARFARRDAIAAGATAASFAQQDREAGMCRWEAMTGRVHPDRRGPDDSGSPLGLELPQ